MRMRIFGNPYIASNSEYRGLYREEPAYSEEVELNKYWDWYASIAGDAGYVSDVKMAESLIREYKRRGFIYETIRIENEPILEAGGFVGIDIASKGGYSLLATGFADVYENQTEIDGIFNLINKYFVSKLNGNGLFEDTTHADLFLKIVREIQMLRPGILEEDTFEKYYLYETSD